MAGDGEKLGPVRALLARVGELLIYLLIRCFGRPQPGGAEAWLRGPMGGDHIGDKPYEECAEREGLTLSRRADRGGLLPDFDVLDGDSFDAARVHPAVRDFYEHTASYRMDVWARTSFPASIGLWLLVTTISRKVDQLNFPLRVLDTARGIDSEIVLLEDGDEVRYTGWYRRVVKSARTLYTGFYTSARVPHRGEVCVKVVFPMPRGSATVLLRPSVNDAGDLELSSDGTAFGDAGFYRVHQPRRGPLRVWRIRSLREHFRVYVDAGGTLRCDHRVRFLGLPVLELHYRIDRIASQAEHGVAGADAG